MKKIVSVLVVLLFAFGAYSFAAGALDGKTFTVESWVKGKKATEPKDELSFADGKLHSVGCDQFGFTASAYTTTDEKGATKFQSTATSEKEGKIEWSGMVKGDAVEGKYVWSKTGQAPIEYAFKGTLKK